MRTDWLVRPILWPGSPRRHGPSITASLNLQLWSLLNNKNRVFESRSTGSLPQNKPFTVHRSVVLPRQVSITLLHQQDSDTGKPIDIPDQWERRKDVQRVLKDVRLASMNT